MAEEPEPDDDDDIDDEAPTAMFVHSVKYSYDPDGPPGQQDLFDEDDEDEPPTAILNSPYRGDNAQGPAPGFGKEGPPAPPPGVAPGLPPSAGVAGVTPPPGTAPVAGAAPQQPTPGGATPPPAPTLTPTTGPASRVPQRFIATQQLDAYDARALAVAGAGTADGGTRVVDLDEAPPWLKGLAVGSVVSAITVLATLVWMLHTRF